MFSSNGTTVDPVGVTAGVVQSVLPPAPLVLSAPGATSRAVVKMNVAAVARFDSVPAAYTESDLPTVLKKFAGMMQRGIAVPVIAEMGFAVAVVNVVVVTEL
jgi:hypothetical protein